LNGEAPKARGSVIAFALSALLIAGFVKFVLWIPEAARVPAASATSPAPPTHSSWPGNSYLEVRAYYSHKPFSAIKHGVPEPVDNREGVLLNRDQERRLIAAVSADDELSISADCWFPRHLFVFWDPLDKPVAQVIVCFDCLWTEGGPSPHPDMGALAELVDDLGLPVGPDEDIESFRKRLKSY
jgi:hypothetical protein